MRVFVLLFLFSPFVLSSQSFTDSRDGTSYSYIKLKNLNWMTQNLTYEAEGSMCFSSCDSIRYYSFEKLEDLCPNGWRLPYMHEWEPFVESFLDAQKARMMEGNKKLFRVDFMDKYNIFESNILNIKPLGRIEGGAHDPGNYIDFWTQNEKTDERFHMHLSPYSVTGHAHKHHLKTNEPETFRLFAVRCVSDTTD